MKRQAAPATRRSRLPTDFHQLSCVTRARSRSRARRATHIEANASSMPSHATRAARACAIAHAKWDLNNSSRFNNAPTKLSHELDA